MKLLNLCLIMVVCGLFVLFGKTGTENNSQKQPSYSHTTVVKSNSTGISLKEVLVTSGAGFSLGFIFALRRWYVTKDRKVS